MRQRGFGVTLVAAAAVGVALLSVPGAQTPRLRQAAAKGEGARRRPLRMQERFAERREAAGRGDGRSHEGQRDLYARWFQEQRAYPADRIPRGAVGKAIASARVNNVTYDVVQGGGQWLPLGPSNIPAGGGDGLNVPVSGRVSAIAAHPTNANIVYVGGAQGGVWKTTNARARKPLWTPLTDREASLAVGAIAIDPVNPEILYVGTGEANGSCDSYYGQGILRSQDGGAHWKLLGGGGGGVFGNTGPFVGRSIARIVIDPATAGSTRHTTLWAATDVGIFSGGTIPTCSLANVAGDLGLWRSTDSGATWELQDVPTGLAGGSPVQDIALDASNHDTLYVTVGFDAVWKTANATGASPTFSRLGNGFPASGAARISLAIGGPGATQTLYSAVEDLATSNLVGLFKTTDGGGQWTPLASRPGYCDGQCFYDMTVAVDPNDPTGSRVYIGGNPNSFGPDLSGVPGAHSHWRSDDGGATWTAISQGDGTTGALHTDDHAWAFGRDGSLYNGNDGGIWRSTDRGASWRTMNTNLTITQFQSVALHPQGKRILGGTQDNGSNILDPALEQAPKWFNTDGGDGGQALIDQSTPARMYHTYFNAPSFFMGPARADDGGVGGPANWTFVGSYYGYGTQYYNGMDPTDPVSFYAPLAQNTATTPNVVYFGSDKVYRSTDPQSPLANVPSWTAVSPNLTNNVANRYLSWIAAFPQLIAGKEVLLTGSRNGVVSRSVDVDGSGIATWNRIDTLPLPNRAVSQIAFDATDATANTAFLTYSGFEESTPATPGHVFVTHDAMAATPTFSDISGNLPDIPFNGIAIDYQGRRNRVVLYAASDIGVFKSRDLGGHWTLVSNGMPYVSVFAIQRNPTTGQVVAATHGRGMFQLAK